MMTWDLWLFGAAMAALLAGCLTPNRHLPPLPNDKLMHALAFAVLTALGLHMAHGPLQVALWLLGLLLAGWLIECLQQLVPDRDFSWPDIAANAAGIAAVALCYGLCALL